MLASPRLPELRMAAGSRRAVRRWIAALALVPWGAVAPAPAQVALGQGTVIEAVERLKPGEFLWAPEIVPEGPLLLIVNLATQRAVLYRNGVPIAVSTVSTGRQGYRTPIGIFTVLEKQAKHFSSIYDNAPMPYMQRLTWQGVALHGGKLPGYPDSHGCIRLPHAFARLLFGVTSRGMTVVVTDRNAVPRVAPTADLLEARKEDPGGVPEWHPERAPTGPISIVVSVADRRVAVLRNGREIGSARVTVSGTVTGTTAYILRAVDEAGHHWFTVPLPGQPPSDAPVTDLGKRFGVDEAFRARVSELVVPGTTVIVTADSLRSEKSPVALIEADPDR